VALIGYGRVSTVDQNPGSEHDAFVRAGCERVFVDHASGALEERPELTRALDHLHAGGALVVWRLCRLGRSLRHLIEAVLLL
jgi:DNA invertase Pin-like site-specific DNA recombinase